MRDLLVITPSRNRFANFQRLSAVFATSTRASWFVCQDDDDVMYFTSDMRITRHMGPRQGFAAWTNWAACKVAAQAAHVPQGEHLGYRGIDSASGVRFIGSFGDDHMPRTEGWDVKVCQALEEMGTGIVYVDDGYQHEREPTAFFMTVDIVSALGYVFPPSLHHFYTDDSVLAYGSGAGCIRYMPEVLIEHLHFVNGKAPDDDLYRETGPWMGPDRRAFEAYRLNGLASDVAKIRALRAREVA